MLQLLVTFLLREKNDTWRSYLQIPRLAGGKSEFIFRNRMLSVHKNVLQCESTWKHRFKRNNFHFLCLKLKRGCITVKSAAEVACSARSGAQITVEAFCCPRKWLLKARLSVLPYHRGCLLHQQMNRCKRSWHRHVALVCSLRLLSLAIRLVSLELLSRAQRADSPSHRQVE